MELVEKQFGLDLPQCLEQLKLGKSRANKTHSSSNQTPAKPQVSTAEKGVTADLVSPSIVPLRFLLNMKELSSQLNNEEKEKLSNALFLDLANARSIDTNPSDFVTIGYWWNEILQQNAKPNLIYKLAYGLDKKRPGSIETLFPLYRMLFCTGLMIEFLSCTNTSQVSLTKYWNVRSTTAKEILAKNLLLLCFLQFKMLHFSPPSGGCCSRSKGHVTGLRDLENLCWCSAVTEKMADRKK